MFEHEIKLREKEEIYKLLKIMGDYERIFHFNGSFGDVYIQTACVKESLKKDEKIAVISESRYVKLINNALAGHIINYVEVNSSVINIILNEERILGRTKVFPIRMLPTLYPMIPECIVNQKLQYIDFLRTLLEANNVKEKLPKIESDNAKNEALKFLKRENIKIGKTVIISADNNTQEELSDEFWSQFIHISIENDYEICLNASGTINKEANKLMDRNFKKINVPPELVVSIAEVAGLYASGNNGYATIQALFNQGFGFHFIKKSNNESNVIKDKFNNDIKIDQFFHKNSFRKEFLHNQVEIIIDNYESNENAELISNIFRNLNNNLMST